MLEIPVGGNKMKLHKCNPKKCDIAKQIGYENCVYRTKSGKCLVP
jgi:hypothetical protein